MLFRIKAPTWRERNIQRRGGGGGCRYSVNKIKQITISWFWEFNIRLTAHNHLREILNIILQQTKTECH